MAYLFLVFFSLRTTLFYLLHLKTDIKKKESYLRPGSLFAIYTTYLTSKMKFTQMITAKSKCSPIFHAPLGRSVNYNKKIQSLPNSSRYFCTRVVLGLETSTWIESHSGTVTPQLIVPKFSIFSSYTWPSNQLIWSNCKCTLIFTIFLSHCKPRVLQNWNHCTISLTHSRLGVNTNYLRKL